MTDRFREFVKKIGSGPHTGKNLTRTEAAMAMEMMLLQTATPAQIGAFLIAHRIKRPTGEELAGMLDAYQKMGPQLQPVATHDRLPLIFGIPYDGRSRTQPIAPIVSLILAAAGVPTILHGGDRMPTKYGTPLIELWQAWGIDWTTLSLDRVQAIFAESGLGFIYTPTLFPALAALTSYRDQIGKRPPLATLELIWCPYAGDAHLAFGFVHPPTELFALKAIDLRQTPAIVTTIKGLEGSTDLPRDRAAIIGTTKLNQELTRTFLHHYDWELSNFNPPILPTPDAIAAFDRILQTDRSSELFNTVRWNAAFYLSLTGVCSDVGAGMSLVDELLDSGSVKAKLSQLRSGFTGCKDLQD
jgi:anthranilate phosphoribosyltransferase